MRGEGNMINRITLALPQDEFSALLESSLASMRTPEAQARFIIQKALAKEGLLVNSPSNTNKDKVQNGKPNNN